MTLVADESVDQGIVSLLQENGTVVYSISKHHASINDEQVLKFQLKNKHYC